jgi:hypothetical protein
MLENEIVGSDTAPEVAQDNNATDGKVNPGVIRKSTTNTILNALSQASGQQFDSVEAALAYVARTSSQTRGGSVQPVEAEIQEPRMGREESADNTDLRDQFMKLQRDLAQKERALRTKELDSEILRNMSDRFDPDLQDYALQKIKSNIKTNRDGSFSIVNQKGQERYGMDGNPLTLQGLIQEIAQGNPKLLKQSQISGGSGLRPGQTQFAGAPMDQIPDYSKDPAAFNAWASKMGLGKGTGLRKTTVGVSVGSLSKKVL